MAADARMQFDSYVVAPANEAAVAAARAVADAPGVAHNPLVIVGGAGVGKTHLLAAIGNGVERGMRVESFPAARFADSWRAAAKAGELADFRERLTGADVLLIDDVQRLSGHADAASGLAGVLAAREEHRRQVVVTSDRPVARIDGLDLALAAQLAAGLTVEIGPPDDAPADGPRPAARPTGGLDFQSFVSDIATAVAEHVEGWKMRVAEAVSSWHAAGYRTTALERLLEEAAAPANYEAVLRGFGATVRRLKELEAEAITADPALAGHDAFRDPERLRDAEAMVKRALTGAVELPAPSVEFSRNGFEVGKANQRAVKAADAVAAEPGRRYNPLVLAGPVGVGKTHLLNALGNELADVSGGAAAVACTSAATFSDDFLSALREHTTDAWRRKYQRVDALLVDDLQSVEGKDQTQDELFHLLKELLDAGRQVVVTSERPPRDLAGLDERLRALFDGGLVVELAPPDAALQAQLYRRFLDGVPAGQLDALTSYLSSRPAASVAEIIGTLHRLTAAADAVGTPLTLEMAKRELEGPEPVASAMPTPVRAAPAVRSAADVFFLDDEKVVWAWRDVASRVLEELR
ncbi:MAG: ATP-binding protein [Gemmatimonadota bacterium]|nr:ATP-binding protein [Gemmatimonadota bacterium]